MKRISMTAIAFALLAYGATAGATDSTSDLIRRDAPKGITETFYACIDKADSGDIEEAYCLSQERELQDQRLNATYKALLRKLDKDQKKSLVEAERAWIKSQDETSKFESSLYGSELIGNLQLTENEMFAICQRANQLDEYLAITNDL